MPGKATLMAAAAAAMAWRPELHWRFIACTVVSTGYLHVAPTWHPCGTHVAPMWHPCGGRVAPAAGPTRR